MPCASAVSSSERDSEHTTTSCCCAKWRIMLKGRILPPRLGGYGKRWQTYRILTRRPRPSRPTPRPRRSNCAGPAPPGTRPRGSAAPAACRCRRRGWRDGLRSAAPPVRGAAARGRAARARDNAPSSMSASAPLSQAPIGAPKPRLGRCRISRGSRSPSACFISAFSSPPATLCAAGICAASSTSSWSSSGTRHSSDAAIVILSVSISRSSGSCVCASTANMRASGSLPPAASKAAAMASRRCGVRTVSICCAAAGSNTPT